MRLWKPMSFDSLLLQISCKVLVGRRSSVSEKYCNVEVTTISKCCNVMLDGKPNFGILQV